MKPQQITKRPVSIARPDSDAGKSARDATFFFIASLVAAIVVSNFPGVIQLLGQSQEMVIIELTGAIVWVLGFAFSYGNRKLNPKAK